MNLTTMEFLNTQKAVLVIVDIQEVLCHKTMDKKILAQVLKQTALLVELAKTFDIPILLTEQYPQGLGKTIPQIERLLKGVKFERIEKTTFGCCGDGAFLKAFDNLRRPQVILVGMETHICVYLSAKGLIRHGASVFIPADAVISHNKENWQSGLALMRDVGAVITNTETCLFEAMRESGNPDFKRISAALKKSIAS